MPRSIIVCDDSRTLLFMSAFDEALDDYLEDYDVYEMPKLSETELNGSWKNLETKAIRKLGQVSVLETKFDPSKRREIDLGILNTLKE